MKKIITTLLSILLLCGCTNKNYDELVGMYQDSYSQRAMMCITKNENGVDVTVSWSSSSTETTVYEMSCVFKGNNKLIYTDCVKKNHVFTDAEETINVESENDEGYFEIKDGKILWTGASDSNNTQCIFEKFE